MAMPEFLTRQIGPLPGGAWVAVVGGGLLIGWYFSKGSAEASKQPQTGPLTEPGVGQGGGQFIYEPPVNVQTPSSDPTTNAQWGREATNWLIAEGYDPGAATAAISKFLTGQNRSLTEQALINLALIKFGSPPEEVPLPEQPTPTIPKPPAPPSKPKPPAPKPVPAYTIHTVRAGETPTIILKRYPYITSWWIIYVANDQVGLRPDGSRGVLVNPYAVKPGMKLVIPGSKSAAAATRIAPPKAGPLRYHTVQRGETLTTIGKKFGVHPWLIYTANDVVGRRADGSKGILLAMGVKAGQRLVIPYD